MEFFLYKLKKMMMTSPERNNYTMKKFIFTLSTFILMKPHFSFAMSENFGDHIVQTAKSALESCENSKLEAAELKIGEVLRGLDLLSEDQNHQIDAMVDNFLDSKIEKMAIILLDFAQQMHLSGQEDLEISPIDNDLDLFIIIIKAARNHLMTGKDEKEVLDQIKTSLKDNILDDLDNGVG